MFQPARLKRAMVASCRLPLGMPSLSLLATGFLFLGGDLAVRTDRQRLGEATDSALVAHQAIAFDFHAEKQRVVVAIRGGGDDAQPVSARLPMPTDRKS